MHPIILMLLLTGFAASPVTGAGYHDPEVFTTNRTGKERLSDKASDEQRMDDCKVPPARRTRSRPANCAIHEP
jgi:hypothetical protein